MKPFVRLALLFCLLASLACSMSGGGGAVPTLPAISTRRPSTTMAPTNPSSATSAPANPPTLKPTPTELDTVNTPAAQAGNTFSFQGSEALAIKYPAYKVEWTTTISGTKAGQVVTSQVSFSEQAQQEPESYYAQVKDIKPDQTHQVVEIALVNGRGYMRAADEACLTFDKTTLNAQFKSIFSGPQFFAGSDGQLQRVATGLDINGVKADQYAGTQQSFLAMASGVKFAQVSVYVSQADEHIVRMEVTGSETVNEQNKSSMDFDLNSETQFGYTYNVTPLTTGFKVTLPEGCVDPSVNPPYPIMTPNSNLITSENLFSYQTTHTLEEVLTFYRTEMPAAGWKAGEENVIGGTMGSLLFAKDGKQANVTVLITNDVVMVSITEEAAP